MLARRVRDRRFIPSPSAVSTTWLGAVALGVALGLAARTPEGTVWVFALLVLSAAVVSIAQQTIP